LDCKWTWFGESAGLPLHNSKPPKSSPISPSKVLPAWKTDPYRHTLRGRPPSPDAIKRCRSTPYFFATLCNIFRGSIEVFRLYFVDTAEEERTGSRSTPDTLESVLTRRLRRAKKQASSQSGRLQNHSRPTRAGGVHSGGSRIGDTTLPDGRDSRAYLAHLRELEKEATAAKRGASGKAHQ